MNRQLKFRVWDNNRFRHDDFFIQGGIVYENREFGGTKVLNVPVQQYTDFLDKNNCEIYEGDIINRAGFWRLVEHNGINFTTIDRKSVV